MWRQNSYTDLNSFSGKSSPPLTLGYLMFLLKPLTGTMSMFYWRNINVFDWTVLLQTPWGCYIIYRITTLKSRNFWILEHSWPYGFHMRDCQALTATTDLIAAVGSEPFHCFLLLSRADPIIEKSIFLCLCCYSHTHNWMLNETFPVASDCWVNPNAENTH